MNENEGIKNEGIGSESPNNEALFNPGMNSENSGTDEILRIQSEIDKVLNAPSAAIPEEQAFIQESVSETPSSPVTDMSAETMYAPPPAAPPRVDTAPYTAAPPPPAPQPQFYQETIKDTKREKKGFKRFVALFTALCLLGGVAGGFYAGMHYPSIRSAISTGDGQVTEVQPDKVTVSATESPNESTTFAFEDNNKNEATDDSDSGNFDLKAMSNRFVDIVKEVEPSVVAVTRTSIGYSNSFYGMGETEQESGAGSGIIFNEDNDKVYIVTNHHVVSGDGSGSSYGTANVYVSVSNSDTVPARLVGSDANADLAVISISREDLKKVGVDKVTVASFGNSDNLEVGEVVLAIGNALGKGNSTSMGLIGTKEKEMQINSNEQPLTLIQTSASINFGNSGGPLINLDGEVVGINTAKANPMVGAEGLGYSIPSNIAMPIIEGLMNRPNTPFLGISGQSITEDIAIMYGLPEAGVLVVKVFDNSSAASAGIQRTDIITSFNGEAVFTIEQLTEKIKACKVGDKVEIRLIRDGVTPMTITATLDKYSDTEF